MMKKIVLSHKVNELQCPKIGGNYAKKGFS
jgi:hypothetical protein